MQWRRTGAAVDAARWIRGGVFFRGDLTLRGAALGCFSMLFLLDSGLLRRLQLPHRRYLREKACPNWGLSFSSA